MVNSYVGALTESGSRKQEILKKISVNLLNSLSLSDIAF